MTNLSEFQIDGANYQAKAVMAFVQRSLIIEESWSDEQKKYLAEPKIGRWENFREQGYVISLRSANYGRQLNIVFYEHRNSDSICAVKWEQITTNTPNIESAEFGEVFKDKWDTFFEVKHGEIVEMSDWIVKEFESFWTETSK